MSLPELFTGTDNTELSALDSLWVRHLNAAWAAYLKISGNAVIFSSGANRACYYYNSAPSSADYDVSIDVTIAGDNAFGLAGRITATPTATGYFLWQAGKAYNLDLYRIVAGAAVKVTSSAATISWTNGTTHTLKLSMAGSVIKAYWDGVEKLSFTDSTPITDAGFPGLYVSQIAGVSYDNFNPTGYSGGNAAPTFPGPNIGNQTGTVGTALSSNTVSDSFSDSDALTFTAVGSWPAGVTVSSAGVISGTPTTAGTYASLSVRATDTAAQTVDSDTFSFTISAAATNGNAPGGTGTSTGSGSGGTATGGAGGTGTITIPAIKDLTTGALRSSQTGITVIVNDLATGALVVKKTAQTTDASGNCAVIDALLVAATTYRVTTILADGSEGTWKYAAA